MVSAVEERKPKGKGAKQKQKKTNINGNVDKEQEVMQQDSELQSLPKTKRNKKEMAEQSEMPQEKQVSVKKSIAKKRKAIKDLQVKDTETRSIKNNKKKKNKAEAEDLTTGTGTENGAIQEDKMEAEDQTTENGVIKKDKKKKKKAHVIPNEDNVIQKDKKKRKKKKKTNVPVTPNEESSSKKTKRKNETQTAAKKQQSEKEIHDNTELGKYKEDKKMTCVDNTWMLKVDVAKYKTAVADIDKLPDLQKRRKLRALRASMHSRLNKKLVTISRRETKRANKAQQVKARKVNKLQKIRVKEVNKAQKRQKVKITVVEKVETPTSTTLDTKSPKKEKKTTPVNTMKKGITSRIIPNIVFKENKLMTEFEGVWVRKCVGESLKKSREFRTWRILSNRNDARKDDPLTEAQQKKVDKFMKRKKNSEHKKLMKILKVNVKKKLRSKKFDIPCVAQRNAMRILKKGKKSMGVINPVVKSFAKRVGDKKATIKLLKLQATMMRNRVQPTEEKRRLLVASKQEERLIALKKAGENV